MAIELPPLPWAENALAPHIVAETIEYHYGKHHQAYVTNLNKLVDGTPKHEQVARRDRRRAPEGGVFNNAAQVWNHTFYWNSMKPGGGGKPTGAIAAAIDDSVRQLRQVQEEFANAGATQFGSGWAWLVKEGDSSRDQEDAERRDAARPRRQAAAHDRRVGARVLHRLPQRASQVHRRRSSNLVNWDFANKNFG